MDPHKAHHRLASVSPTRNIKASSKCTNKQSTTTRKRRPYSNTQITENQSKLEQLIKQNQNDESYTLISYHQLPKWAQDNEFILKYYRQVNRTWYQTLKSSFFQFHNETYNIYSHLIPAIIALTTANHFLFQPSQNFADDSLEKAIWVAYLLCASTMLTCSWWFHASFCQSYKSFCLGSKLDYAGIAFMIVGSFLPWLFYTLYCEKTLFRIYFSCICVLGVICIAFSLLEKFAQPDYRAIRASVFVALGLFAVIPVVHLSVKIGFYEIWTEYYLWTLFTMAACYIIGAIIFAVRVPECWFPGKFDRLMNSHNIFHTLIVIASLFHFTGVFWLKQDRLALGHNCSLNSTLPMIFLP